MVENIFVVRTTRLNTLGMLGDSPSYAPSLLRMNVDMLAAKIETIAALRPGFEFPWDLLRTEVFMRAEPWALSPKEDALREVSLRDPGTYSVLYFSSREDLARKALAEKTREYVSREAWGQLVPVVWWRPKVHLKAESEMELLEACDNAGVKNPRRLSDKALIEMVEGHVTLSHVTSEHTWDSLPLGLLYKASVRMAQGGWYPFSLRDMPKRRVSEGVSNLNEQLEVFLKGPAGQSEYVDWAANLMRVSPGDTANMNLIHRFARIACSIRLAPPPMAGMSEMGEILDPGHSAHDPEGPGESPVKMDILRRSKSRPMGRMDVWFIEQGYAGSVGPSIDLDSPAISMKGLKTSLWNFHAPSLSSLAAQLGADPSLLKVRPLRTLLGEDMLAYCFVKNGWFTLRKDRRQDESHGDLSVRVHADGHVDWRGGLLLPPPSSSRLKRTLSMTTCSRRL